MVRPVEMDKTVTTDKAVITVVTVLNLGNYIHLYSITLVKGCKRILY